MNPSPDKNSLTTQHTPTPWHVASSEIDHLTCVAKDDYLIAGCASGDIRQAESDAAYIVKCVNEREQLIDALNSADLYFKALRVIPGSTDIKRLSDQVMIKVARALAQAEGKE